MPRATVPDLDDDWTEQHRRELAALHGGSEQPPSDTSPLSGLSFLPAWLGGAGDAIGGALSNPAIQSALRQPKVRGAIEALGFTTEQIAKPAVGAVAAAVDPNSARRFDEITRGKDPTDVLAGHAAAKQVFAETGEQARLTRENPAAPLPARIGALARGAIDLGTEVVTPVAPGAGLALGALRAPVKAARAAAKPTLRVVDEAAEGVLDAEQAAARVGATTKAQADFARSIDPERAAAIARLEELGVLAPKPANVVQFPKAPKVTEATEAPIMGRIRAANQRIAEMQRLRDETRPDVGPASPPVTELPKPQAGPSGAVPTFGFQVEKFPDAVQPYMRQVATDNAELLAAKTGPVTWAETVRTAQELGEPVSVTASRLARHGVGAAELEAVRIGVAQKTRAAMEIAAKVTRGTASPEEKLRGLMEMQEAAALQSRLHEAASEAGRTLNILRSQVDESLALGPSEAAYKKAIALVARDPDKADEFFQKLIAIDPSDTAMLGRLLRDMNKADFWTKFDEYYKANLLWSPATHETNIVSGLYQQGLLLGDVALSRPTRVPDYIHGWLVGQKAAMDRIPGILGEAETAQKWGASRGSIPGPIGRLIRIPYTALALEDAFQTSPMYNGLIRVAAKDAAQAKGLKGAAQKQFIEEFLADPPLDARGAALKRAEDYALHGDSKLAQGLLGLPRGLRYLMGALFIQTPVNLAKLGVRYSPLGALRPVTDRLGRQKITPMGQVFRESMVIGGGLSSGFYLMLEDGNMTGLYPKSRAEAQAWAAEGRQPLMVRASEYPMLGPLFRAIHGEEAEQRWYSAGLLGPLLWPAMLAAAVRQTVTGGSEDPAEKQIASAAAAVGRAMLDQIPMFQGYRRVNELLSDPVGGGVDFIGSLARGVLPAATLSATVERMTDSFKRSPEGVYETILAQIPGLAQNIRTQQDVLGRDVPQDNSALLALLPRSSLERIHPVIQKQEELVGRLGTDLARLSKASPEITRDVSLDRDELHRYQALLGEESERRLGALASDPRFNSLSFVDQGKEWETAKAAARNEAKRIFATELIQSESPEKRAKAMRIGLSASSSNYWKAKLVERWLPQLEADPSLASLFDENRGEGDLTLAQYRDAVPLIKRIEEINKTARFSDGDGRPIGSPKEWAQYDRERKRFNAIGNDVTKSREQRKAEQNAFRITHPVFNQFDRLASRSAGANPQITLLKRQNPILEKFPLPDDSN